MFKTVRDLGGYHQVSACRGLQIKLCGLEMTDLAFVWTGDSSAALEAGLQLPGGEPSEHERSHLYPPPLREVSHRGDRERGSVSYVSD